MPRTPGRDVFSRPTGSAQEKPHSGGIVQGLGHGAGQCPDSQAQRVIVRVQWEGEDKERTVTGAKDQPVGCGWPLVSEKAALGSFQWFWWPWRVLSSHFTVQRLKGFPETADPWETRIHGRTSGRKPASSEAQVASHVHETLSAWLWGYKGFFI